MPFRPLLPFPRLCLRICAIQFDQCRLTVARHPAVSAASSECLTSDNPPRAPLSPLAQDFGECSWLSPLSHSQSLSVSNSDDDSKLSICASAGPLHGVASARTTHSPPLLRN